jgi:hypothetical protein
MFARYQIGDCRIGIVHGDADSLAGWRFDRAALDDPESRPWLSDTFNVKEALRKANEGLTGAGHDDELS